MKFTFPVQSFASLFLAVSSVDGYLTNSRSSAAAWTTRSRSAAGTTTSLPVSIGLGPEEKELKDRPKVAGVDFEIPDHEEYRTSRRSKLDEQCDEWYGKLLGDKNGILGSLADEARELVITPVELKIEEQAPLGSEEWTPYVTSRLPWTPLVPAYGLEQYGLPVPRRNAETWRHFDVTGLVEQDYSASPAGIGSELQLSGDQIGTYKEKLREEGAWLDDDACLGRLVYVDGRFAPQLSKTTETVQNLDSVDNSSDETKEYLARLTDGFSDTLAAEVPIDDDGTTWTSYKTLSGPDHSIGDATSQFAINTQQGTACFAALNTIRTGAVAYVHASANQDRETEKPKPVLIVNAVTSNGSVEDGAGDEQGVAFHPRTLVVADEGSRLSVVQSVVDLSNEGVEHRPKMYNGYTQFFVKENANVTHSYLEESGGLVTGGVEMNDEDLQKDMPNPREVESQRPQLKDTHFEAIDVHMTGDAAGYQGTMMGLGGSGRVRTTMSVTLLRPEQEAIVNGFLLSGGTQRTDMKTNIHHIAEGTSSRQVQKNMIGGRATGAFRGRIRVEQSAQLTESEQLSRTILLSDRARAWAVPSLEIIADDVQCAHGATVSDLSEEELFYLRSRGLSTSIARNLLMYAFAGDISACVDPAMLGSVDSNDGLQKRVIQRLENLVPRGQRAIKGEFQSV